MRQTGALGSEGRARFKIAVMGISEACAEEVRLQCPRSEIVCDLFHVAVNY